MFVVKNIKCVSAGAILWRIKNGICEILIQRAGKKNWYGDTGGKCDSEDKSVLDTIAREIGEETNEVLKRTTVLKYLQQHTTRYFVNRAAQYLLCLTHCPDNTMMPSKVFGTHEKGNPHPRVIQWVPLVWFCKLSKKQIHPRIHHFWHMMQTKV